MPPSPTVSRTRADAVWRGLWSVKRGAYRNQPLGDPHDAVADCKLLLAKLEQMAQSVPAPRW